MQHAQILPIPDDYSEWASTEMDDYVLEHDPKNPLLLKMVCNFTVENSV